MNLAYAAAAPDIYPVYWNRIKGQEKSEYEYRVPMVLDRVKSMQRVWSTASVAARNLALHDAIRLLAPGRYAPTDWSFTQFNNPVELEGALEQVHKGLKDPRPEIQEALNLLDALVEKAKADAYATYTDFERTQYSFNAMPEGVDLPEAVDRYETWFKRFRPYLVVDFDLHDDSDANEAKLRQRIDFFLSKNPEPVLRTRYEDRLWAYIYDVRGRLISEDQAPWTRTTATVKS